MSLTLSPPAIGLAACDTTTEVLLTSSVAALANDSATPAPAESAPRRSRAAVVDVVEEWGLGSFPASDPPSNW
ncbi:hypothetical protein [Modestobacter lapidis]|nr:hypothetical protein [Modestobacter lapidis]